MRISLEADYALRIIDYLSSRPSNDMLTSKDIARLCTLSERITLKVLHKLHKAKIVKSFRGANGGYCLELPPSNISYFDVIKAIDGEIYLNKCIENPLHCNRNCTDTCNVRKNLISINKTVISELKKIKFKK